VLIPILNTDLIKHRDNVYNSKVSNFSKPLKGFLDYRQSIAVLDSNYI
jgi:hypothetical protein